MTTPIRIPLRREAGFTLVEMAVALTLAAIAGAVVFGVFFRTQTSFVDTREVVDAQADVRVALALMTQDIRGAGASPTELPFARIATAASDTIRVQSDLNGNGAIDVGSEPPEDVTWFWDAGEETLMRRTAVGELPVARGVTFFGMNFLDADGAELDDFPLDRDDRAAARAVQLFVNYRVTEDVERSREVTILLRNADPGV